MNKIRADIALISVTNTEYAAVTQAHNWRTFTIVGDDQLYAVAEFERDGKKYTLVHAKQDEMGMTAAAAITMKLTYEFRPKYIIMVGIVAGIALKEVAEQMYGDVIVADVVWNVSAGKFVNPEKADITFGEVGFLPRFTYEQIPGEIIPYIRMAIESPENECRVHLGPMSCGTAVVANSKILEKPIYSNYRNTIGLDMESYAVLYAANHATDPRPIPIIIKSVCDYATSEKSDDYHRFAAFTSCQFAKLLYEKYLPLD